MGEYRIRAVLAMTATAGTVTRIKQTSKGIINQSTNIEAEGCRERMAPCNRPLLLMCVCVCVAAREVRLEDTMDNAPTHARTFGSMTATPFGAESNWTNTLKRLASQSAFAVVWTLLPLCDRFLSLFVVGFVLDVFSFRLSFVL